MMENAAGGRTSLRDCKLFEDVKRSDNNNNNNNNTAFI